MTDTSQTDLGSVVQFQSIELSRLVRDNKRLNERVDLLLDDIRALRELQRRDQRLRAKELSLREKDQTLHQGAQESIREMIEMAFILPKQSPLTAPVKVAATKKTKMKSVAKQTGSASELAAIHRNEGPETVPPVVKEPLFAERYRQAGNNGTGQAAWPEIPSFLRRTS